MPGELENIHIHQRGVGDLDEGDPFARDHADRIDRQAARQNMETVEDETDARMIGPPYDLPGVPVIPDMPAPGKGLIP